MGATMLKTVARSSAKKTDGIAVTYRAGTTEPFGTCPTTCELNCSGKGADEIDAEYLDALLSAVPRKGVSFTYSHFDPHTYGWGSQLGEGKTVINFSAPTKRVAAASVLNRIPAVTVVSEDSWQGKKTQPAGWGVRLVRCPAEYLSDFSCADCGGGLPLCARRDRNYAIGFTAHGAGKRKAADPDTTGGCYAAGGNVALHWRHTADQSQDETDAERLTRFARGLPPRSIIRHHVAGDIGRG